MKTYNTREEYELSKRSGVGITYPPQHDKTAYELKIENNKLRDLLHECSRRIEDLIDWSDCKYDEAEDLLTRINTALGESEE